MSLLFSGVRPQDLGGGQLDPGKLLILAIVADGREFDVELYVQSVGY